MAYQGSVNELRVKVKMTFPASTTPAYPGPGGEGQGESNEFIRVDGVVGDEILTRIGTSATLVETNTSRTPGGRPMKPYASPTIR